MSKKKSKETPTEILSRTGLSLTDEMFCRYYTSPNFEFYGNGVRSYMEAFSIDESDPKQYAYARVQAHKLLQKPRIIDRINSLLEDGGFNDTNVDKQLNFLLNQNADFNAKLGAIREYNKLKQRITSRMEHIVKNQVVGIEVFPAPTREEIENGQAKNKLQEVPRAKISGGKEDSVEGN